MEQQTIIISDAARLQYARYYMGGFWVFLATGKQTGGRFSLLELNLRKDLEKSYNLKSQQVAALSQSISISNNLFMSAKADYMEVLLTQRDALEAKFELIETKKQQMNTLVQVYQMLGGGWK